MVGVLLAALHLAPVCSAEPSTRARPAHTADVPPALLAAICGSCHRPDNAAMPVIHGRSPEQLLALLARIPEQSDVTVMHRLTVGLSAGELVAVARELAAGAP